MDETKLTVRISRDTLEHAKEYAREHDTTVTRLVVTHLERVGHLGADDDALTSARVTRRLAGSLGQEASEDEYRDYLRRKYG
jgi:hypothetical protein